MNIEPLPSQGTILPKGHVLVRKPVKAIKSDNGNHYQFAIKSLGKEPVIRCQETGKIWHINWNDLLKLAREAGIDTPHPDDPATEEPE